MTEDDLAELMKSKMMSTSATYESNLQAFGYASEDDPSQINIYPLDFEQRRRSSMCWTATMPPCVSRARKTR